MMTGQQRGRVGRREGAGRALRLARRIMDGMRAAGSAEAGAGLPSTRAAVSDQLNALSDELDERAAGTQVRRRLIIRVLVTVFLLIPTAGLVSAQGFTGRALFLVPGTVVFIVLVDLMVGSSSPLAGWQQRWYPLLVAVVVLLGTALFAVGRMNWLTALAIAAAALGRFTRTPRIAMAGVTATAGLGLAVSSMLGLGYGSIVSAAIVPALGGFLAHSAERRNYLIYRLRETRAELARMAVAEERLRIARDLHDLLGHSLSLIALKAELAGRLLEADPARAAGELADLETVARRSLTEVRQAVTSYRQPGLAAELAAACRMLTAAGVDARLGVPASYSLPPAVDALLAWTVREGATNIVRHAAARRACIRIEVSDAAVSAELTNDAARAASGSAQPAGSSRAAPGSPATDVLAASAPASGSGLPGLAERAAGLGGTMTAGPRAEGGFRLQVEVPLTADRAIAPAAGADPPDRNADTVPN